jgi:hypothetical protein
MTTDHEIAAYYEGKLGPGQIGNYEKFIRESGLTIPILGLLHIGRPEIKNPIRDQKLGDLIFNDYPEDLLVGEGQFNPLNRQDVAQWPDQVASLKQRSSVKKISISIGGQGKNNVVDFRSIRSRAEGDKRSARDRGPIKSQGLGFQSWRLRPLELEWGREY